MTTARIKTSAVFSSASKRAARAGRRARVLAPLLIASTTFGCAGELADGAMNDGEDMEVGESQQALEVTDTIIIDAGPLRPTTGTVIGTFNGPTTVPKEDLADVSVAPWAVLGLGQLMCSRSGSITCGTEKADWVGPYQLDVTCDDGFYDPIYGGTCWKCPTDDGRGTPWIRTLDAVTKDTACHREGQSPATRLSYTGWAGDCKNGAFWDTKNGAGCWTCPADRPRRTLDPVDASTACATWGLETSSARLVKYNGCPKPNIEKMGLTGKRTPGQPFLDVAGGWNEGVASGGCYACPVSDAEGNILITERNASPIYGNNQGCDVLFKFKPSQFPDPGLSRIPGVADLLLASGLLDAERLTKELYLLAEGRGLKVDSEAAKNWVAGQWKEIETKPYQNASIRTLVLAQLLLAAQKPEAQRTAAERKALEGFEGYINARRVHVARTGLEMYDAWKLADERAKSKLKRTTLEVSFDYGTVPFKFHETLATAMSLGATGVGIAGGLGGYMRIANTVQFTRGPSGAIFPVRGTTLNGLSTGRNAFAPLQLLKLTATANAALGAVTAIEVAFAIIQSIAIDQFIEIISARPKLEAALAVAKQPVKVQDLLAEEGGSDQVLYWWSKAMEGTESENARVVAAASAAAKQFGAAGNGATRVTVLDPTFYVNKYPDLKAQLGTDTEAARTHFLRYGIAEGRDASATFSIGAYLARYADLQKAFGDDYAAALDHWFAYGKSEGRSASPVGTYMDPAIAPQLNPIAYADRYPDVKKAFGYKVPQIVKHWVEYGIAEKRLPY